MQLYLGGYLVRDGWMVVDGGGWGWMGVGGVSGGLLRPPIVTYSSVALGGQQYATHTFNSVSLNQDCLGLHDLQPPGISLERLSQV